MIEQVRTRVYQAAARILGIKGTGGFGQIDVAPTQPVHDFSRLAWQFPGYFTIQLAVAAAGAGTFRGGILRSSMFNQFGALEQYNERETDVWLVGHSVLVTTAIEAAAGFGRLTIGIRLDDDGLTGVPAQQALPWWYGEQLLLDEIVATQGLGLMTPLQGGYQVPMQLMGLSPILLPRGNDTAISAVVVTAAAVTATTSTFLMWAGPKGQLPPGHS